jgi:heme A synthase
MGRSRLFAPLALTTALLTIGLIIFGAVVRVTDSGLGCGNHWPSCNGTFFPPLDNLTAWIEWLHRLFALLIGLFGLVTLAVALRVYRKQNRMVLIATVIAALMFVVQSALGALVVVLDLPPTFVTLHLAAAMLLLGALLLAAIYAVYTPAKSTRSDGFAMLAYVTTALSLVIIMTGALVRGSGATLACTDWPLCNGQVLPFEQGTLQTIHMFHRFAVAGLGLALVLLVWQAAQNHRTGLARGLTVGALLAYLAQAGIGALYVFSSAAPLWGAAHVGFAATTWALLVALSVIETMNNREKEPVTEWQSKALSN